MVSVWRSLVGGLVLGPGALRDRALALPVSSSLGAIAAYAHIAPAPAAVLAGVEKQPAAPIGSFALAYATELLGQEQLGSRACNRPDHAVEDGPRAPLPSPVGAARFQVGHRLCPMNLVVECLDAMAASAFADRGWLRRQQRIDGFAQLDRTDEHGIGSRGLGLRSLPELARLSGREQPGAFTPLGQTAVVAQEVVAWLGMSRVDGVGEVQTRCPANEAWQMRANR